MNSMNPKRQGFYEACLEDQSTCIAEWREHDKAQGKQWWVYRSEDPTIEKKRQPLTGVTGYRNVPQAEVDKALARERTVAERIEVSYKAFLARRRGAAPRSVSMPDCRRLAVGTALTYGFLANCQVVQTHEEGHLVTFSYRDVRTAAGTTTDNGTNYMTVHWMDLVATDDIGETNLWQPSLLERTEFHSIALEQVVHRVVHDGVDDSPDYQRGYVWSDADKDRYLDSLFTGRDLGRFIFVTYAYPHAAELFDGKQRLSALVELVASQRPYRGVYWHQMSRMDRRKASSRVLQVADVPMASTRREDLLQMFLDVNAAGVPQTEDHLGHVRDLLAKERAKAT